MLAIILQLPFRRPGDLRRIAAKLEMVRFLIKRPPDCRFDRTGQRNCGSWFVFSAGIWGAIAIPICGVFRGCKSWGEATV